MPTSIVLAIFIASTATFDASIVAGGLVRHDSFPNSVEGIELLGKWINESPLTEFDRVCVSGRPIGVTPALRFWSTRKVPVRQVGFDQVELYMVVHKIAKPSAEVVASTCSASLASVPKAPN